MFLSLPYGHWGMPVPMKTPLLYAIGRALHREDFVKGSAPTEAEVDAAHKAFVEAMRGLFDRYKGLYGWHDAVMRIV